MPASQLDRGSFDHDVHLINELIALDDVRGTDLVVVEERIDGVQGQKQHPLALLVELVVQFPEI